MRLSTISLTAIIFAIGLSSCTPTRHLRQNIVPDRVPLLEHNQKHMMVGQNKEFEDKGGNVGVIVHYDVDGDKEADSYDVFMYCPNSPLGGTLAARKINGKIYVDIDRENLTARVADPVLGYVSYLSCDYKNI